MASFPHLAALLSLQAPSCQICQEKSNLLAMPHCKCATTVASSYVNVADLPMPPPTCVQDSSSSSSSAASSPSMFLQRLLSSPACQSKGFTTRKPPTKVYKNVAMCRACLENWSKSSNDVQVYDYHRDPNNNRHNFTIEVKCPQCKAKVTKRALDRLLTGSVIGDGSDEWNVAVQKTKEVAEWGNKLKRWAKMELSSCEDVTLSSDATIELKGDILRVLQNDDGDDAGSAKVHRQCTEKGEIQRELMGKDRKYRQEVEDFLYVKENFGEDAEAKEAEERRRLVEEDARIARELAEQEKKNSPGNDVASLKNDGVDPFAEEKKSEEMARRLEEEWRRQEEEERREREEKDAALAKMLQEKEKNEPDSSRKRKKTFDNSDVD